ncbi:MAG: HAMP domain-containing protein [Desulfobacterales bacterium]|nr:HAMP domain-containing protein [Desulfobacterales bacterium]
MAGFPVYRFKSLRARHTALLVIPLCILMFTGGILTFVYTRNIMLEQWNETAVLKLQRAAHDIEMRLARPMTLLNALFKAKAALSPEGIVEVLTAVPGVMDAAYTPADTAYTGKRMNGAGSRGYRRMAFHRSRIAEVSPPSYDAGLGKETVAMTILLSGSEGKSLGSLSVVMGFDYLLEDIKRLGWWQSDLACLVTGEGRYLAHTNMDMSGRTALGENGDPLETAILAELTRKKSGTVGSGEHPPEKVAGFYSLDQVPWVIILFAKGDTVLRPIILYRNAFFLGSLFMAGIILIMIRFYSGRVIRDIGLISEKAGEVAEGNYGAPIPVPGRDEISRLIRSYNAMVSGLKERDAIRNSFGRYVDPEFAKTLMARPEAGELGGTRREVVILMSDIRGFTHLSESLSPETTIEVLNHYFSRMITIVQAYQGIVVDFFGDAILVFFDPVDGPVGDSAARALDCARIMQEQMDGFNREMAGRGLPALSMGIGVHAGQVIVGNIGAPSRTKYGIVGSAVNITSRIQGKAGKGEILVSSALLPYLDGEYRVKRSFAAELKGISALTDLHVIRGIKNQL